MNFEMKPTAPRRDMAKHKSRCSPCCVRSTWLASSNMPPTILFTSGGRGRKVANNSKNSNSQQKRRSSRRVCLWPLGYRLLRRVCFRVLLHEHIDLSNSSSKQAATVAAGGSTHLKQNPVTRRLRKPKSGNIWMAKDSQNMIRMEAQ